MTDRLYADHPELYDAIQSEWDYDRDVSFVRETVDGRPASTRLLEVGCGTGEHTRRFAAVGFDVVGVDPSAGMLSAARRKCDAALVRTGLPDLAVAGAFDAVVAVRGVLNHLAPDELAPALRAMSDRLAPGGVLVFDNAVLPPEGNHPAIDVGEAPGGQYARIAQHVPQGERLDWRQVVFAPDGSFFADSRPMTPFDDEVLAAALADLGLAVDRHDGYGPDDDRTVFVARDRR